jgi:hypothetical protein
MTTTTPEIGITSPRDKDSSDDKPKDAWFIRSLTSLGYPDAERLLPCLHGGDGRKAVDYPLYLLVTWLETHHIHEWDTLTRQDKLLHPFYNGPYEKYVPYMFAGSTRFGEYLKAVECPPKYIHDDRTDAAKGDADYTVADLLSDYQSQKDSKKASEKHDPYWYHDPVRRVCVIQWLCELAIRKAYIRRDQQKSRLLSTYNTSKGSTSPEFLDTAFPLGFTTGDQDLDKAATAMRMKFLLVLRHKQDSMNACVRQLQHLSILAKKESSKQRKAAQQQHTRKR